jgi:Arc/MetJ-type ribon-helix-helix transcriptional regulator
MQISLSEHLSLQVEQQLAAGGYRTAQELVEEAVSLLLEQRARAKGRIDSLRRIGQMVDDAGLYERVLVPPDE